MESKKRRKEKKKERKREKGLKGENKVREEMFLGERRGEKKE